MSANYEERLDRLNVLLKESELDRLRLLEIERVHFMSEEMVSARIKDVNDIHLQELNELRAEITKLQSHLFDANLLLKEQNVQIQSLLNQSIIAESKQPLNEVLTYFLDEGHFILA